MNMMVFRSPDVPFVKTRTHHNHSPDSLQSRTMFHRSVLLDKMVTYLCILIELSSE